MGKMSEKEGSVWGRGQRSNMPQEVIQKDYPMASHYKGKAIDDTITGVDASISSSESKAQKHLSNQH